MNHNKEIIEVFEAVLFALVCPFTFLLGDMKENEEINDNILEIEIEKSEV